MSITKMARSHEWLKVMTGICLFVVAGCNTEVESTSVDSDESDWSSLGDDFDSLLQSINSAAESVLEYLGDEDGCKFKCQNGAHPVPNKSHTPSFNGCGSLEFQIDTTYMPPVTDCCNEHDICYDTCNKEKDDCDEEFKVCLTKVCGKVEELVSKETYRTCKNMADIMYAGTMTLGCKSYRAAQKEACLCDASQGRRQGQKSRSTGDPKTRNEL